MFAKIANSPPKADAKRQCISDAGGLEATRVIDADMLD
jgi:hypothetical protein